jgi:quinol monooxygenase YgiN
MQGVFVRVIRFRWLPGEATESARLARALVQSAQGQPACRTIRVLSALEDGSEGLVVFEWATRQALDAHVTQVSIDRLAPWAMPLLQWRTDQCYTLVPLDTLATADAPTA